MLENGRVKIAIDGMGGDHAPESIIEGLAIAAKNDKFVDFLIFGNEEKINPILADYAILIGRYELIHTEKLIAGDDKISAALRQGKDSSMWLAINSVKTGEAHAAVSGGNTGALMAISKLLLKTLPDIDRPAIAVVVPTERGPIIALDMGANVDCNSDILYQFAIMGNAFAKVLLHKPSPTIGLLNIGSEDIKGNDIIRSAYQKLKDSHLNLNFQGFIEGNDLATGKVDVIVTDGFAGNVALKTAEGTAKLCLGMIKKVANSAGILAKIGFYLARPAFKRIFKSLDYRAYNGAMFLGLNGIIVKSHGSMDGFGFSNAIKTAASLARDKINDEITQELMLDHGTINE